MSDFTDIMNDTKKKTFKDRLQTIWWYIEDFFKNWIWPAYHLKNVIWNRYDVIKLKGIKATEYSDVVERMLLANVELLDFFLNEEKPEEFIEWYGEDGPKYGRYEDDVLYSEYRGKYVMDIMKECHEWFTVKKPVIEKDMQYVLNVWCKWLAGKWKTVSIDAEGNEQLTIDETDIPTELSFFDDKNIDWDILDKFLEGDRENLVKPRFLIDKYHSIENLLESNDQRYLHLCIEMRPYMWT